MLPLRIVLEFWGLKIVISVTEGKSVGLLVESRRRIICCFR